MSCTWISVLVEPDWASENYHEVLADEKQKGLTLPTTTVVELLSLARQTLDEVKNLTEYEDQKANRILAAMAFLSALAGFIYSGLLANNQGIIVSSACLGYCFHALMYALAHSLFFTFVLLIIVGAFYSLWAVAPRFRVPKSWGHGTKTVKSPLFFAKINEVSPRNWMRFFYTNNPDDVKKVYYEAYVHEAYLVAEKVSLKCRILQFGVRVFIAAVVVFAIWVVCVALYIF